MPMAVAGAFSATRRAGEATAGPPNAGPTASVAVPAAALPAGSRTAYVKAEVWLNAPGVGVNARLASCATVSAWPAAAAAPFSVTVPSVGRAPKVTLRLPDG